jgi:hypothetical protein
MLELDQTNGLRHAPPASSMGAWPACLLALRSFRVPACLSRVLTGPYVLREYFRGMFFLPPDMGACPACFWRGSGKLAGQIDKTT